MRRVLIIEDDALIRSNVEELLEAEGFEVEGVADGKSGVAAALSRPPDVIVCDIMMPAMDGHEVLRRVRDQVETAGVPFIFLTARAEREDLRLGMSLGADDYVTKPFTRRDLLESIRARIERRDAFEAATKRPAAASARDGAVVESAALRAVYQQAARAAQTPLSVVLLGETGSGKDVLARAIHQGSPRADRPFVALNCAALPEALLESELFGHERGAFTGATEARVGLFELADGGTVFLDEVGDIPMPIQAKLLRVLEDRRVMRVGGRAAREIDVRFVSATNRALDAERMRPDLYFRIAGIVLTVPPLRDRPEDLLPLAERFVAHACAFLGRTRVPELSPSAIDALRAHAWPGNVRELRNVIEQAVTLSDAEVIDAEHLPLRAGPGRSSATTSLEALRTRMREADRARIVDVLERHGGNQTRAADELGISRRTLLHRLDEYGLPRPRKKG